MLELLGQSPVLVENKLFFKRNKSKVCQQSCKSCYVQEEEKSYLGSDSLNLLLNDVCKK